MVKLRSERDAERHVLSIFSESDDDVRQKCLSVFVDAITEANGLCP